MAQKQIKCAVIGAGHMGRFHIQKFHQIDLAKLVGICDIDIKAAQALAHEFNTQAFSKYEALLPLVDAVCIAAPTAAHFKIAQYFLENKKHVLIEKPITQTIEEAQQLNVIARRNDVILQIGHLERFNPANIELETLLDKPRFIECHRLAPFKPRSMDVNVVLDLMIHDIDLVLNLVKSPIESIQANGSPVLTQKIDIANARITFKNGCVANITSSRVSMKSERKLRVFQENQYVQIDFNEKKFNVYQIGEGELFPGIPNIISEVKSLPEQDALFEQNNDFVQCIVNNRLPRVSGEDGERALRVANRVNECINTEVEYAPI